MDKISKKLIIKLGGSLLKDSYHIPLLADELLKFLAENWSILIVHGGGPQIDKSLAQAGFDIEFNDGIRVTHPDSISLVESSLSDLNKMLVNSFSDQGIATIGCSSKEAKLIMAQPFKPDLDFGLTGSIHSHDFSFLHRHWLNDNLVLLSPVCAGIDGKTYNVNADSITAFCAQKLLAEVVLYFTDVDGIIIDGHIKKSITPQQINHYIKTKKIIGGMIPKANCLIDSINPHSDCVAICSINSLEDLWDRISQKNLLGTAVYPIQSMG